MCGARLRREKQKKNFIQICSLINMWNNLPNSVVDVNTISMVKACLDNFWTDQNVK